MNKLVIIILLLVNVFSVQGTEPPKFIKKVYDDIFRSMSNGKIKKPVLQVIDDSSKIIYYTPDLNAIVFSEKFARVMRTFGKDSMNAVAHVLGHELAHVILQQGDFLKLGSGYADADFNEKLKGYQGLLKDSLAFFERQADENAIFYAHISGYQTTHIAEKVLDSIYASFKLKDKKLKNYPELSERIAMVESSSRRMEVLLKFYDFGIIATMKGQLDQAIYFFELIQNERFTSKEVLNNLGTVNLMKVKSILKDDFPYDLPFQIDCSSSLSQQRDISDDVEQLLEAAKRCFDEAIKMDERYYFAILNNQIREFLSGTNPLKIQKNIESMDLDFPVNQDHWILHALCDFKQGNNDAALTRLNQFQTNNGLVIKLKCQLFKTDCITEFIQNFDKELPSIDIALDSLSKKRGDEFRGQLKYLPQISNARIKVSLYKVEKDSFFNITLPDNLHLPPFSITEYSVDKIDNYQVYNPENFTGWMRYESNGVTFVTNKKVALKYSNNQLTNLYKF
jgi:tetratricopeptide (TPR) repeat protein